LQAQLTRQGHAAILLIDRLPKSPVNAPREHHAKSFGEQAKLLDQADCHMFFDVPDHLRAPFFRFNAWNEHFEGC
jgi:hypothetical protein